MTCVNINAITTTSGTPNNQRMIGMLALHCHRLSSTHEDQPIQQPLLPRSVPSRFLESRPAFAQRVTYRQRVDFFDTLGVEPIPSSNCSIAQPRRRKGCVPCQFLFGSRLSPACWRCQAYLQRLDRCRDSITQRSRNCNVSSRCSIDMTAGDSLSRPDRLSWIAASLKRSIERSTRKKSGSYRSALSVLTFYINRAGKNLPAGKRRTLQQAQVEFRKQFKRT